MEQDLVRSIERSEFVGFAQGQRFITMTSIRQNGAIPRQDGWHDDEFYVYAERPWDDAPPNLERMSREWYEYLTTPPSTTGHPGIGTTLFGDDPAGSEYEHLWLCPKPIGALTIIGITGGPGMSGLIAFTSLSGQTGSFDVGTQQWSFASHTTVSKEHLRQSV